MDAKLLILALLVIPMILLIGSSTMESMTDNSRTPFEVAVANETVGTGAGDHTFTYHAVNGSVSAVYNASDLYTNYTMEYNDGYELPVITVGADGTGQINVSYTSYQNNYANYLQVRTGTWSGFTMGSQLPFIYIAIAVITLILGAFGLSKVF